MGEAPDDAPELRYAAFRVRYPSGTVLDSCWCPKAVECLAKDREVVLLVFYDFPAEHRVHLSDHGLRVAHEPPWAHRLSGMCQRI